MELITQIRLSSSVTDSHGLPVVTEIEIPLQGIVAARTSNTITEADVVTVTQGITIYLATGTEVLDDDRFIVRGKRYIVDGEAFDWRDGLGSWNPGTVVNLVREKNG